MKRSLVVRTIPMPTREDILRLDEEGRTTREIAEQFQVCESWVRRVKQQHREFGKTKNATKRNRQPKWIELAPQIEAAVAQNPDMTLPELKAKLGTELHEGTLCRALKKLGLTFKKKS